VDHEQESRCQLLQAQTNECLAETKKIKNETDQAKKDPTEMRRRRQRFWRSAFLAGALFLVGDYIYCESDWNLERCIRRRASSADGAASPADTEVQDQHVIPFTSTTKPTLILGPSGSGRTRTMEKLLKAHRGKSGRGLLLSFRGPHADHAIGEMPCKTFDDMMDTFLASAGVPLRSSYVSQLWLHFEALARKILRDEKGVDTDVAVTNRRLLMVSRVLSLAFSCAHRDCVDSNYKEAWLICIDDLDEFLHAGEEWQRQLGASVVAGSLGHHIRFYSSHEQVVHIALTANSFSLLNTFRRSGANVASRWRFFHLKGSASYKMR
jgi:hypothetical protein